ncbi:MAG: hypothetical protein ACRC8W_04030 [Plesiomonas shigelloides]
MTPHFMILYDNASSLPLGYSTPCSPAYLGEPDQVAGGCQIYRIGDVRVVVTLDPIVEETCK